MTQMKETVSNELDHKCRVILPMTEEQLSGVKVDPYEHVTVNGKTTLIKRGEYVYVEPEVYIQLRNRYPTI